MECSASIVALSPYLIISFKFVCQEEGFETSGEIGYIVFQFCCCGQLQTKKKYSRTVRMQHFVSLDNDINHPFYFQKI